MNKEVFVQIGLTALRGPDGSFLPAVPLYVKADPADVSPAGQYIGSEPALADVADIFADKFRQYAEARKAAAI
jgi:hypothetical protein